MSINDYTNQEINQVVNSFKSYIKLVANHASIDYIRKIKSQKYQLISFSELVEKQMPLSRNDNGIFSFVGVHINTENHIFSNKKYEKAFKKLSKKEQSVLILYSDNISINDISKRLKITTSNVTTIKSRAVNKFKRYLKEN